MKTKTRLFKVAMGAAIGAVLWSGCSFRTIEYNGAKYRSGRIGAKENFTSLEITGTNGTKATIKGYQSDQTEALGVAVEAAVKAAIGK